MNKVLWENVAKNTIILPILIFTYFEIEKFFLQLPISDNSILGLLVAVSILAVTACFGCFAFTYEKVKINSFGWRLMAHLTTGVLMLLIGLSLEMTFVLARSLIGDFYILSMSLVLLYISIMLYDFWDLRLAK